MHSLWVNNMPLFSTPELREYARTHPLPVIAIAHSDLGIGDATHILNGWAQELIHYAKVLGYEIIDISGPDLTYERMTGILQATKPAVLFNFSHGCRTYLIGNDMRCTLTRGWEDPQSCGICGLPGNLENISGTAIIAYSCHSGAQLGKCAIQYGSPAYVGFSDYLIVVSDAYRTQDIFRDALMPMSYRILEGTPVGMAVDEARFNLIDNVKRYKPVKLISVPLCYDYKYLVLHGNPDWKLI